MEEAVHPLRGDEEHAVLGLGASTLGRGGRRGGAPTIFCKVKYIIKKMFLGAIASLERAYGGQLVTINPLILL